MAYMNIYTLDYSNISFVLKGLTRIRNDLDSSQTPQELPYKVITKDNLSDVSTLITYR